MKRLLALILAAVLLCGVAAAAADELPYMRQIPQYTFYSTSLLTPESYPQVCVTPFYPTQLYESNSREPWFVTFSVPADTYAAEFKPTSVSLIDETHRMEYFYEGLENYAFETFVERCKNDDYVIYDGEGQHAAYIDPEKMRAYGLIGLPEIKKGAKLFISIYMGGVGKNVAEESLAAAIIDEIARVESEMTLQLYPQYWTDGAYAGVKMLCPDLYNGMLLNIVMPELTGYTEDGGAIRARMFVTEMSYESLTGYIVFGPNCAIDIDIKVERYSYPEYKKEDEPENCAVITLDRGVQFDAYLYGLKKEGSSSSAYASYPLPDEDGCYLNIDFSGRNVSWGSFQDFAEDLNEIVNCLQFVSLDDDPYVPGATYAPKPQTTHAPQAPAGNSGIWVCPGCKTENSGNFCTNCGTKRPEDDGTWVCPGCKTENNGNFCTNCGTKKP